jgi:hypothetical protein
MRQALDVIAGMVSGGQVDALADGLKLRGDPDDHSPSVRYT